MTDTQLRAKQYKVRISDCFTIQQNYHDSTNFNGNMNTRSHDYTDSSSDDEGLTTAHKPVLQNIPPPPPIPTEITSVPYESTNNTNSPLVTCPESAPCLRESKRTKQKPSY